MGVRTVAEAALVKTCMIEDFGSSRGLQARTG